MAEKEKRKKQHIVVFQDEDNTVLKTSFVLHGESAVPPVLPTKKGETAHHEIRFSGWDKDFNRVEDNLVIKAVYENVPKKYLVLYFHENGKMLGMESVPYGNAAKAKVYPVKESDEEYDYIFMGWNCPLEAISRDTNAKAVFEKRRKIFTVRFYHENGSLLKKERVQCKQRAYPPRSPVKKSDLTFHYIFDGWDKNLNSVTEDMDVHARFSSIYNEYTISFYDEEQEGHGEEQEGHGEEQEGHGEEQEGYGGEQSGRDEIQSGKTVIWTGKLHYGDAVPYPDLRKKGYDLHWSSCPKTVDGNREIVARWTFSNPVGRKISTDHGVYEIINPSVRNGSVRCLQYNDSSVCVKVPETVRLGDYYYRIEVIGTDAFRNCIHMQKLYLPNSVRTIEERGLAHCRQLRAVYFGKGIMALGACAFAEDVRLQEISFPGNRPKKCHKKAFEKMKRSVKIRTGV